MARTEEYYFYVDSTPTHSYMKYLYKYPQAPYPYQQLIDENHQRDGAGAEFNCRHRYLRRRSVFRRVRRAAGPDDICIP
jgi:hypothetical protein